MVKTPILKRTNLHELKSNITYDEIQQFSFPQLSKWVDELRNEIVELWDTGIPPTIGKSKEGIIKSFRKLKEYPVENLFFQDKNYPHHLGFIKNNTKTGVNQFFPAMYETKIDRQPSIYDFFTKKDLQQRFKRHIVRNVRFDGMYSYSRYLINQNGQNHTDFFREWKNDLNGETGFWLEVAQSENNDISPKKVWLDTKSVKKLLKMDFLRSFDLRNVMDFDENEPQGYYVRFYDKQKKVIQGLLQIFRIGLGTQPAVNFPPLTSRLLYEKFLPQENGFIVYDFCAGWGGRLLGALCSNRQIHYVGTDVNTNNKGCYERLGEFYNSNCGGTNTYEIYYEPSEEIHKTKSFQKHKGQIDLVLTSPPYFGREIYSSDKEQSCIKFPNYRDWLNGFLRPSIETCWTWLKPNSHLLLNVADVKMGENNFIPLEQDTIELAVNLGFEYVGKIEMVMSRMIGLDPVGVKNRWFDETTNKIYKTEPILIMKKGEG